MKVFIVVWGENGEGYDIVSTHATMEGAEMALDRFKGKFEPRRFDPEEGYEFATIVEQEVIGCN